MTQQWLENTFCDSTINEGGDIVVLADEEPGIATWHLYFQCTTEGCCGGTRH